MNSNTNLLPIPNTTSIEPIGHLAMEREVVGPKGPYSVSWIFSPKSIPIMPTHILAKDYQEGAPQDVASNNPKYRA